MSLFFVINLCFLLENFSISISSKSAFISFNNEKTFSLLKNLFLDSNFSLFCKFDVSLFSTFLFTSIMKASWFTIFKFFFLKIFNLFFNFIEVLSNLISSVKSDFISFFESINSSFSLFSFSDFLSK